MNMVVNFVITIFFVCLILGSAQAAAPQAPIFTPLNSIVMFIPGYCVACFIGEALPVSNWANKAVAALRITNKVASSLITALIFDVVFTTILSMILCWVNNIQALGLMGTIDAWLHVYPIALPCVFVLVLIVLPLSTAIAAKVSGFDPRKIAQGGAPDGGPRASKDDQAFA
ncbi:hypothetical protein C1878_03575 [Gordonibacter sp. 28C]|nr:hypothetical protein C1878_03575 [Gordonibacter sp. 28C]